MAFCLYRLETSLLGRSYTRVGGIVLRAHIISFDFAFFPISSMPYLTNMLAGHFEIDNETECDTGLDFYPVGP